VGASATPPVGEPEARLGASFRVYTPEQLKDIPLRPAHRPAASPPAPIDPTMLVRWLGAGVAGGALALAVILGLSSLATEDPHRTANTFERANAPAPAEVAAAPEVPTAAEPTDFELPDDNVAPQRPVVAKRTKTKAGINRRSPY
jgi:hypothetical protein